MIATETLGLAGRDDCSFSGLRCTVGFLHGHHDAGVTRYRMREKLFAIGEDFWIETEGGERAFKVNGEPLRIRDTSILEGPGGEDLFKAQAKKLHIRDTMKIERDGDTVAEVSKRWFRVRETYGIEIAPGQDDALVLAVAACIDEMEER